VARRRMFLSSDPGSHLLMGHDSFRFVSTSATETKLLTYMFALCLKVDGFATDTTFVAHDLSRSVNECVRNSSFSTPFPLIAFMSTRVNTLFKSLG